MVRSVVGRYVHASHFLLPSGLLLSRALPATQPFVLAPPLALVHHPLQAGSTNRGANGEDTVARRLAAFPEEFFVINDLATPFGNLDHIVVGPTGVFILDTKAWRGGVAPDGQGELLLNGHPTEKPNIRPFIGRMLGIRDKVRSLAPGLDPYYQPVFVFTSARVEANRGTTGNLHCIRDEQLHDYIVESKSRQKLQPEDAKTIAQAFLGLAYIECDFTAKSAAPLPPQTRTSAPASPAALLAAAAPRPALAPVVGCATCGRPVSQAEQSFCRGQRRKLGGRLLCRACQKLVLAAA